MQLRLDGGPDAAVVLQPRSVAGEEDDHANGALATAHVIADRFAYLFSASASFP